jgi:predicted dehydrogenase
MKRMSSDGVRVVMVGAGGMGHAHGHAWQKVEGAELVAVCDCDGNQAKTFGETLGVEKQFSDFNEAVRFDGADVVDICLPNRLHTDAVLAALAAKKHVLCEKPLATTPGEIERMIAASQKANRLLMPGQSFRFDGKSQPIRDYVQRGALGDIYYGRAWFLRRRRLLFRPTFTQKALAGGGACLDIGIHVLDLAMWMMGHPKPVSVTGIAPRTLTYKGVYDEWDTITSDEMDVEDFAAGLIRFENGAALSLETAWMLNMQEDQVTRISLFGTKAGIEWPSGQISSEEDGLLFDSRIANLREQSGYEGEIRAFYEAIVSGGPSPVPAEQSLDVVRVLSGLYESHRTGAEVRL